MQATEKLYIRLKLKRLNKEISESVEWNFGYCPQCKHFDSLLEKRNSLLNIAREKYSDLYDMYAYT